MRLDKAVTMAGLSRSEAKEAIRRGRVTLNGGTAKDAALNVNMSDSVCLDGQKLDLKAHRHIMLFKPAGYLTATEDARGDRTVMELIPQSMRFKDLGPVGRLDRDVTGLLILTTDGELAHRLISPKRDVEKQYFARVEGKLGEGDAAAFERGVELKEFKAKPARLTIVSAQEDESLCRVFVTEGKFHQVKRMLLAVGHPVIELKRERIAELELDPALREGECRFLTDSEERVLYAAAQMETR